MPSYQRDHRGFSERPTVERLLAPILSAYDAELVDLELVGSPGGRILRVFIEKAGSAANNVSSEAGSVVVDTCARIARELSPALDVADVISGRYNLEVSTPGVERALRTKGDFTRFGGKKARLTVQPLVEGSNVHTGILAGVEAEAVSPEVSPATSSAPPESRAGDSAPEGESGYTILLTTDGEKTVRIPGSHVVRANLVFEFGATARPSRGGNPKNKHPQ